jgi:hypothetical protein
VAAALLEENLCILFLFSNWSLIKACSSVDECDLISCDAISVAFQTIRHYVACQLKMHFIFLQFSDLRLLSSCELTVHSEEKISRSQTSLVQYTMYRLWKQSYLCHILWWFADVYCKMKCFVSIRFDLWHLLAHFLSWTRTLQAWISGPFFNESLTRERNRGISTNKLCYFWLRMYGVKKGLLRWYILL